MKKHSTGEPYAGKPPVRFGGRGGESLPDPYQTALSLILNAMCAPYLTSPKTPSSHTVSVLAADEGFVLSQSPLLSSITWA
jgi:hypothetical protein